MFYVERLPEGGQVKLGFEACTGVQRTQWNRHVSPGKSFNLARSFVGDEAKTTDEGWVLEAGEASACQGRSSGFGPME